MILMTVLKKHILAHKIKIQIYQILIGLTHCA